MSHQLATLVTTAPRRNYCNYCIHARLMAAEQYKGKALHVALQFFGLDVNLGNVFTTSLWAEVAPNPSRARCAPHTQNGGEHYWM